MEPSSSRRLALTLDVPSAATGTGSALVLDGRDVAMLRCSVLDGAARIAQAASAEGQANIRLRVGARIADANTSDDAAFNVAKDGEAAIAALNGAAAAERRRMIGKRKRGGSAFAFAGSF